MNELEEITEGKSLEELLKELEWQISQGESLGGAICSHLVNEINRESNFAFTIGVIHISAIAPGDVIIKSGKLRTVDNSHIKRNSSMGITIFGDSYRIGTLPVLRVSMNRATK